MPSLDNIYHQHLDVCKHCEDHPWDLCPIGAAALKKAAKEALDWLADKLPDVPRSDRENP